MKWDSVEFALLIDLYNRVSKLNEKEIEKNIEELSNKLYTRGENLGWNINDEFRNSMEISIKLKEISDISNEPWIDTGGLTLSEFNYYKFSIDNPIDFKNMVEQFKEDIHFLKIDSKDIKDSRRICLSETTNNKVDKIVNVVENTIIDYEYNRKEFENDKKIKMDTYVDFEKKEIEYITSFSTRTKNILKRNKIIYVSDLIKTEEKMLWKMKGYGANCHKEVTSYLATLNDGDILLSLEEENEFSMLNLNIGKYKEQILSKNFDDIECNEDEKIEAIISKFKKAYELLDEKLIDVCLNDCEKIEIISGCVNQFCKPIEQNISFKNNLVKMIKELPLDRQNGKANVLIKIFKEEYGQNMELPLVENTSHTLKRYINELNIDSELEYKNLMIFLKWCLIDINAITEKLFENLYKKSNIKVVLELRSRGKTLEEVGEVLEVTRERVRQIEAKAMRQFVNWNRENNPIGRIVAERDGDTILTTREIESHVVAYAKEILYLMKNNKDSLKGYIYDKNLDVYIWGKESILDKVESIMEEIPNVFEEDKLNYFVKKLGQTYEIPEELLEITIKDEYKLTGKVYHRTRLSLSEIYKDILEKYYHHGIRVYDTVELNQFRNLVKKEYGDDVKISLSDRALSTRISDVSILCGRGVYRPKKEIYLSEALSDKIFKYMRDNKSGVFLTNTLLAIFRDELIEFGIDNKYYLQGVLKELYADKFVFSRDYVSKIGFEESLRNEIIDYVHQFDYPVTKKVLFDKYPGISEIILNMAINDGGIINLFGEYLHGSKLNITNIDKTNFKMYVDECIKYEDVIHVQKVYDYILNRNNNLLLKIGINSRFKLFSVLEFLLREQYDFERPYIAQKGVEIVRNYDRLMEIINDSDEMDISDISAFARENHFQINSIIEFINSINKNFALKDKDTIIRIELLGITEDVINEIRKLILSELQGTELISNLSCVYKFPKINVSWNEWLIYSVVNKFLTEFEVSTTSNQFRLSFPVISYRDNMNLNELKNLDIINNSEMMKIDDMDDIDALISDMNFDDLEGEE